jgi:hypothetical protein
MVKLGFVTKTKWTIILFPNRQSYIIVDMPIDAQVKAIDIIWTDIETGFDQISESSFELALNA